MRQHWRNDRYTLFFLLLYSLISAAVFFYILFFNVPSDMGAHIQILLSFLEVGSFPTPPLYYALVYGLHFIMPYKEGYGMAALLILTAAGFFKYLWSLRYLQTYCPGIQGRDLNLMTFALMFFAPVTLFGLEGEYWYLGKFTPVIWHNSTTLLVFPFCILLFIYSVRFLEKRRINQLIPLFALGLVILLIKPSFLFPFIPVFPVIVLFLEKDFSKPFFYSLLLCLIFFGLILIEKVIIYDGGRLDEMITGQKISDITIKPLYVWSSWTQHPFRDFVFSFLFPATFIFSYHKQLKKDIHFLFSSFLVLFGIIIFLLFVESGPRLLDGNFYWQIILTLFIWYLVLVKHLFWLVIPTGISVKSLRMLSFKNRLILILFVVHCISGIAYLARIISTEKFL